jgi:hypothetical protein
MDYSEPNRDTCINTIKDFMIISSNIPDKVEKVNIIIEMFEYLLTVPQFLAKEAKFRNCLFLKIDELFNEAKTLEFGNKNKFLKLMKNIKVFLDNLKSRNDYIPFNDYVSINDYKKIIITL